jgi:hypothetical protein
MGGEGRRRSLYCCRFLGHDPPPGEGAFEPRLRLNRRRTAPTHQTCQCALALLKWRAAEVAPVELKEVEGAWRHHAVVPTPAQKLERGEPVIA